MKCSPAIIPRGYATFLKELKTRIASARVSAARSVNRELVFLYWDIGRAIVEKQKVQGWGESVVERLANDLQRAFPGMRGFSTANIWRMKQLVIEYSSEGFLTQALPLLEKNRAFLEQALPEMKPGAAAQARKSILAQAVRELGSPRKQAGCHAILAQAVRELAAAVPWGHHVLMLGRLTDPAARLYYLRATAQFGWSRNVLLNQLKGRAFERARREKKTHNFALVLPEHFAEQAEEMLKSSYNLGFLGIDRPMKERELEEKLIERLRHFILELGYGFCFVGQQYRLALGSKEYFVDLLFYHRFLRRLVAFDLKLNGFVPEFAGKMDFYLNVLNDTERGPDDLPSIGVILCAEKDDVEVEYALKTKINPIGVAEYQLQTDLPPKLRRHLPTARQLADVVREVLPARQTKRHANSNSR